MNISLNWLKEYISIEKPVNELAHKLTMCGLEIQKISQHEASKDVVLEAEVTTNRPDWLGYIGIAREIGAIMGKKVTYPNESIKIKRVKKNNFDVSIQDNELCPFYSAVLLENIEFGDTPKYIKEYLEAIGIRSINLPVDLSNYVLFEYNQPLHAFDFDKIGNSVIIRRARKGEKFVAINDKEYSLDRNDLVICDENKAIALAGVMGGLQSEVSIKTRNILLESAFFNPVAIRKTSRKLQVMSESSYRFERRIDPMNVVHASNRFVHLLSKHAKIGSISPVITDGALSKKRNKIKLHFAYVNKVLGISIPKTQIKSILNRLEISVVDLKKDVSITLAIPSFRHDLERPIDLIEEIARVYGYDKITETYPVISMNKNKTDKSLSSEDMMRNYALGVGASEIITYTLVNPSFYTLFAPDTLKDAIQIVNPSNKELTHMRPTLFTGMLDVIKTNVHNGQKNIKAFELGRIYVKNSQSKLPREEKRMSIAITGFAFNNWMDHNRPVSFCQKVL